MSCKEVCQSIKKVLTSKHKKSDFQPKNPESTSPPEQVASPNSDIPVIFEDSHIIVVIKPQGVLVDNLLLELKKDRPYVATVHRLDQVTGGVMMFAKSSIHQILTMPLFSTITVQ